MHDTNEQSGNSGQLQGDGMRAEDLRDLIDEYWCLAYNEGKEGRSTDTEDGDAQRVSTAIDDAIRELAARQPVGVKPALSAEEINALPEQARRYIMWLETEADPGHTTKQNFRLTEENKALRLLVAEMQKEAERGAGVLAGKVVAFEWDETRACVEFTSRPLIGTKLYTAPPAPAAVPYAPEGYSIIHDSNLASLRERAALPVQTEKGEVWYWQGDGYDFPESLVCPVIMQAETLRQLIASRTAPAAVPVDGLRDAERLDWLMRKVSGKELREIGVDTYENCTRADIDAAMLATHPQPAAAGRGDA